MRGASRDPLDIIRLVRWRERGRHKQAVLTKLRVVTLNVFLNDRILRTTLRFVDRKASTNGNCVRL